MLDGFQDSFREEAYELLTSLEQSLLELEDEPTNVDVISAVFRSMHTIKGSAGMFGFDTISSFAHHVETMFDEVRNGKLVVTNDLIDLTLACRDHIRAMLEQPDDPALPGESARLVEQLESQMQRVAGSVRQPVELDASVDPTRIGSDEASGGAVAATIPKGDDESSGPATWHIRFVPNPDIMANGTNPLLLVSELHDLGDCTVHVETTRIPPLGEADPALAAVAWDVFLTTSQPGQAIRDVFMFVEDQCHLVVRLIDHIEPDEIREDKRLGQILVERGVVDAGTIEEAVRRQQRLGELLVGAGVDRREVESALEEQEHIRRSRQKAQGDVATSTIRVASEKLDELVDLVGELVTLQARLTQVAGSDSVPGEVVSISESFDRLIGELRDHTMSVRMVPISSTFPRFKRLVRDLARDLGKEVDLATEGGDTELDKTVIERLADPLVHVIRNSVDHGLEAPDTRRAAGKPAAGTVKITAQHSGANVEVRVSDDGKGLDRERIKVRAVERGLIPPDTELSDAQIFDLVFQPGFSTAATVSQVSGRGVGMDVVRKQVESIGGSVSIRSETGRGTQISMSIPLTLAIIDGLLVRLGSERFVVPLGSVEECLEYHRSRSDEGYITNRGEPLPIVDLRDLFVVAGERPDIQQAVVVETQIGRVGFVVDAVIGDHQTVIKNLGQLYKGVEGVSGATILGDGSVALILDVQRLAQGQVRGRRRAG